MYLGGVALSGRRWVDSEIEYSQSESSRYSLDESASDTKNQLSLTSSIDDALSADAELDSYRISAGNVQSAPVISSMATAFGAMEIKPANNNPAAISAEPAALHPMSITVESGSVSNGTAPEKSSQEKAFNSLANFGVSVGASASATYLITFHTWNQDGGVYLSDGSSSSISYNEYTPAVSGNHAVTGCTATATSQIIYYWGALQRALGCNITVSSLSFDSSDRYYSSSSSIGAYIDDDAAQYSFLSFSGLNTALSHLTYTFSATEIAALVFGVGIKLQSEYGLGSTGGTGAIFSAELMQELGFTDTKFIYEYDADGLMTSSQYNLSQELIENLSLSHPVMVAMQDNDTGGRHAVIIDGYNSAKNTFHFNMGWGGSDDGWYSLSALPDGFDRIDQLVYDMYLNMSSVAQTVGISVMDSPASESGTDGTFRITRSGDTTSALTVYFTVGGTATSGDDYTLCEGTTVLAGSAVIAAGETYADITLKVIDDALPEGPETVIVNLTNKDSYTLDTNTSATITITDNEQCYTPVVSTLVTGEIIFGEQRVIAGGIASSGTIKNGGSQFISSGGKAIDTIINSGGVQYVSNGGLTSNTVVNSSGVQTFYSGGTANGTIIHSGDQLVSGGNAVSTLIDSWGSQNIYAGGRADFTVDMGGMQSIYAGGVANSAAISSLILSSGFRQGMQMVNSGGMASNTHIYTSARQYVYEGGVARNTIVDGRQDVDAGQVVSTVVNAGALQYVYNGGSAGNTSVGSGGMLMIGENGSVSDFLIVSGGVVGWDFNAFFSGINNGVPVSSSTGSHSVNFYLYEDIQYVSSGYIADKTSIYCAEQRVLSSGTANSVVIHAMGSQTISSGGVANATVIYSQGSQTISSGGVASATKIESAGVQTILASGSAEHTVVNSGGQQVVYAGGMAISATINNYGSQIISSGGWANFTAVGAGGMQYVCKGGAAGNMTVGVDGTLMVYSGGAVSGNLILAGGSATMNNGSSFEASSVTFKLAGASFNSVLLTVVDGTLKAKTVYNTADTAVGWSLNLDNAAVGSYILASGTNLDDLSTMTFSVTSGEKTVEVSVGSSYTFDADKRCITLTYVNGATDRLTATVSSVSSLPTVSITATGATAAEPAQNGTFRITRSGDTTSDLTVYFTVNGTATSGTDYTLTTDGTNALTNSVKIAAGAAYVDITLKVIDDQLNEGPETATMVLSANNAYNLDSASSGSINIADNDLRYTPVVSTLVSGETVDGKQSVISSGIASAMMINSGGLQNISGGGQVINTTINSGGNQFVSNGGVDIHGTINSGGNQFISSGGRTINTVINAGGNQFVSNGGGTINGVINSGGNQDVSSGGAVSSYTVNGGVQNIFSGGFASLTTVNGGSQYLNGGTAVSNSLNASAMQMVYSGGVASKTSIANALQYIHHGGIAGSTTISGGGLQNVNASGIAIDTWISSGGKQAINAGGVASNTSIGSGGLQLVSSGVASNTSIGSGGSQMVYSGGVVSGTLVLTGGSATFAAGSSLKASAVAFILSSSNTASQITVNDNSSSSVGSWWLYLDNAALTTYILVSGTDLSGLAKQKFTVTRGTETANLTVGSNYTFADNRNISLTYTDAATDQLTVVVTPITPTLSITATDASAGEPSNNGTFRITRTGSTAKALTVWFNTSGTATQGSDYTLSDGTNTLTGSVVIAAGSSYVDVTLKTLNDNISESTESAILTLTDNNGFSAPEVSATVNISDDELSAPSGLTVAVTKNSAALDWADSTFANYEYQIDNNSDFTSVEKTGTTTASNAIITALTNGTYYWRVRTADNNGNYSDWTDGSAFSTKVRDNLSNNDHSQIVAWDAAHGAVGYVATDGNTSPSWNGIWAWDETEAAMWKVVGVGHFSNDVDQDGILLYNGSGNTFAAWTNLNDPSYGYVSLGHVDDNFSTKALANFDNNG